MKAFEKWWKEENTRVDDIKEFMRKNNLVTQGDTLDFLAKTVWKGALEWILTQPDDSCGVRRCVPMEAIRDELEKTK